jgi:hypothetical protein
MCERSHTLQRRRSGAGRGNINIQLCIELRHLVVISADPLAQGSIELHWR